MAEIQRFKNRTHAGEQLARRLRRHAHAPDAIVLALPRGGVPVGFAIARKLGIALDVLVVRKLGMPRHEEFAMGAVGSGGVRVLQPDVPGLMGVTAQDVETVTARELAELERRERLYRGQRPPLDLRGRNAILGRRRRGDRFDGAGGDPGGAPHAAALAGTGCPGGAAGHGAQAGAGSGRAGLPGGAAAVPLGRQWYEAFDQTSDEQVQTLLTAAWQAPAASHQPTGGRNDENTDDG